MFTLDQGALLCGIVVRVDRRKEGWVGERVFARHPPASRTGVTNPDRACPRRIPCARLKQFSTYIMIMGGVFYLSIWWLLLRFKQAH